MRRIFPCVLCLAIFFSIAPVAQAIGPKGDAFVGYSYIGANSGGISGWETALNLKVAPFVGVEGDVAGYVPSSSKHAYLYFAGPRVTVGVKGVHLFAHGLIGGSSRSGGAGDSIGFTYAVGGGMDFHVISRLSWRVAGDYIDVPEYYRAYAGRVSTGAVLRF